MPPPLSSVRRRCRITSPEGATIAPSKRPSFQKRAREKKKAEQAAQKRDLRNARRDEAASSETVATRDDLAAYGLVDDAPSQEAPQTSSETTRRDPS